MLDVPAPIHTEPNPKRPQAPRSEADGLAVTLASYEVILCHLDERPDHAERYIEVIRAAGPATWGIAIDLQIEIQHEWFDVAERNARPIRPWSDVELIVGHRAVAEKLCSPEFSELVLASVDRYAQFAAGDHTPEYEPLHKARTGAAANPWRYNVTEADFRAAVGLTVWLSNQSAVGGHPVLLRENLQKTARNMQVFYSGRRLVPVQDNAARELLCLVLESRHVTKHPVNVPQHVAFSLARQWLTDHEPAPTDEQLEHLRNRLHVERVRLAAGGWDEPLTESVQPAKLGARDRSVRNRREAELRNRKRKRK